MLKCRILVTFDGGLCVMHMEKASAVDQYLVL